MAFRRRYQGRSKISAGAAAREQECRQCDAFDYWCACAFNTMTLRIGTYSKQAAASLSFAITRRPARWRNRFVSLRAPCATAISLGSSQQFQTLDCWQSHRRLRSEPGTITRDQQRTAVKSQKQLACRPNTGPTSDRSARSPINNLRRLSLSYDRTAHATKVVMVVDGRKA